MKKTVVTIVTLVLTLVFALGVTGCGGSDSSSGSDSAKKITFCLDWTPNTNHTGLYVAQEKGYFEDEGLEVEIVQPPEDGCASLVGSGKAQFGIEFQGTMAPSLIGDNKLPITGVAAVLQHETSGIISLKEKGIERPRDMEGHTYATWDSPVEQATLKQVIENDGGDFSKVEMIPSTVTDEVSAFKKDTVDAIWIYEGWAGIACDIAGLDTNYWSFRDIDEVFDYYSPLIIANNDFLENDPETAKAFLRAASKGYTYAAENPEEAAQILLDANEELKDSEELVMESQKFVSKYYIDDAEKWGVIDPDRWNAYYEWLNDNDLVDEKLPKNAGLSTDYIE